MGTTINELSAASSVISGDQVLIYSTANGDTRRASVAALLAYIAANLGDAVGNSMTAAAYLKTTPSLVSALPTAAAAGAGARRMVTDATQTLAAGHGATVAGGGANVVPVVSNGTVWMIG